MLTGERYERLVARYLGDPLRAGIVNRVLYNGLHDVGYHHLIHWLGRPGDLRERANRLYAFTVRAVVGGSVVILRYALVRLPSRSAPAPASTEAPTND